MKTTSAGIELHYDILGSGPAVLFVHGFPLTGQMWQPSVATLSKSYRCIVPDLRGFGRSQASPTASMRIYADDLATVLDAAAQREPVVVVGLSMGGYVQFEFFRQHRSHVRAMVLADTRANEDNAEGRAKRQEMIAAVAKAGSKAAADAMIDKLFAPGVDPTLRREWLEIMSTASPMGVMAAVQAMADRPDSRPTLATIDVPTLIAVGEHDAITPPDVHREMHQAIRGSQMEVVPGAGHMLPVEKPAEFATLVGGFIERAVR